MGHITKIYEALLNRKEKVCSKAEIVQIIEEYKKQFRFQLKLIDVVKYLSRHGYIKRIFLSFYYINSVDERKRNYCFYEDKELIFIALNKSGISWYVGLQSALYVAGRFWQVPTTLYIVNNSFSGERKICGLKVRFFKIKDSLFLGLKRAKTKHNIKYCISNLAKTYIDFVYLKKTNNLIKTNEVKKYLRFYPKWIGKI